MKNLSSAYAARSAVDLAEMVKTLGFSGVLRLVALEMRAKSRSVAPDGIFADDSEILYGLSCRIDRTAEAVVDTDNRILDDGVQL